MAFFLFYLFSIFLLGSYVIGPFSIRVYMTVIMMVYLITHHMTKKKKLSNRMPRNFIIIFIVFLVMASLALTASGDFNAYGFSKLILANFLNCVVTFFAIDYFVDDIKAQRKVLVFISMLISADAIITVLQHIGNPIGQVIAFAFTTSADYQETITDEAQLAQASMFGESLPIGFFGYVHSNATYLATMGLIPVVFFIKEKNTILKVLYGVATFLCIYACLCAQERAAFFLFIFTFLYLFYSIKDKKNLKVFVTCILLLFVISYIPSLLSSGSLGRLTDADAGGDVRNTIWDDAGRFIPSHLLWGGPIEFSRINDRGGHNFFLNGLINYGIIGSFVAFYLYFSMIIKSIPPFLKNNNVIIRGLAGSILVYSGICQFHNASIMTGDTLIFLMYPLLLKALVINKNRTRSVNEKDMLLYR